MSVFRRAERRRAKLRIAIDGPSGSGKTHSALRLAMGLCDNQPLKDDGSCRIVVIDSEKGSANFEAGKTGIPPFDTARLDPPFSPSRYRQLLDLAAKAGYEVIITDSISHAWSGEGGLLDMKDRIGGKDPFAAWRKITPEHNRLVDTFLSVPAHVICTMRTKTLWDFEEYVKDGITKKKPIKLGLKPEMREGVEYEFTIVFDLQLEGNLAQASKDRTSLFLPQDGLSRQEKLTEAHGQELLAWVESGADTAEPPPVDLPDEKDKQPPKRNGIEHIYSKAVKAGMSKDKWREMLELCELKKDKHTWTKERLASLETKIDKWIELQQSGGDKDSMWTIPLYEKLRDANVPDLEALWGILIKQVGFKGASDEIKATQEQREKLAAMVEEEIRANEARDVISDDHGDAWEGEPDYVSAGEDDVPY